MLLVIAAPLAVFFWLQTSMVKGMDRKFVGTSNIELMEKFEERGFDVMSLEGGRWNHPSGLNVPPIVFYQFEESLRTACPKPDCQFHAARKSTPYLGLLQKVERAAWASRDGNVVHVFSEHLPMVGNL
ncbi:hypothetical protein RA29_02760 [Tateyamaria sp. ANG-S1]|nr:hypothetical protein RA29_02760 [Tateyamaria sp. ANG-S1]